MPMYPVQREEGAPEWMVSFADMVTILMAFFVVMFSMAGTKDEQKEEAVMGSLRKSLGPEASLPWGVLLRRNVPFLWGGADGNKFKNGPNPDSDPEGQLHAAQPTLKLLKPGERTPVGEDIFFLEGSTELSEEQRHVFKLVAKALAGKPQRVEIRGHATRRPLDPDGPYADHWELAFARCRLAMDALVAEGIDPARIRLSVAPRHKLNQERDVRWQGQDSCVDVFLLDEFSPASRPESGKPTP